jgi:hypothetical protein
MHKKVFSLNANENKNLSTTQINLGKEDEVIVLLLFFDENKNLSGRTGWFWC